MWWENDERYEQPFDPPIFQAVLKGIQGLRNLSTLTINGSEAIEEMWIFEELAKLASAEKLKQLTLYNFEPDLKELAKMSVVLPALEGFRFYNFHNLPIDDIREMLKKVAPRLKAVNDW